MIKITRKLIRNYLLTTLFLWTAYTIGLTPIFMAFVFNWDWILWFRWMITGLPANFILNYPIGKGFLRFAGRYLG